MNHYITTRSKFSSQILNIIELSHNLNLLFTYLIDIRASFDTLCDYLGNQVTYLCRKTINPSTILTGDVDIILKLIHKCLKCCNNFIAVYTEVISNIH